MLRILTIVTVILGLASAVILIAMFGALHDISQDYASAATWSREGLAMPEWVPEWVACELEWQVVEIGWWVLAAFHVAFFANLLARRRGSRRLDGLE